MNFPKLFLIVSVLLFGSILFASVLKSSKKKTLDPESIAQSAHIILEQEVRILEDSPKKPSLPADGSLKIQSNAQLPQANRIAELFNTTPPQLPIVETITYKSRVSWQKGRPAWLSDYAGHYHTSRHFIARSLNGKVDYLKQDVAEGDRFNVFKEGLPVEFYLLVDLSRAKLWFYYHDLDSDERVLLKTYSVGLGRPDASKPSGYLTPLGKYKLGDKIAIYEPNKMGYYQGQKTELIRVFGTRWIPFEQELEGCSAPAKGFGIHGLPWALNEQGKLVEVRSSLGKYESDGCIRLATEDIEEIFAIVVTKPTVIELVKDFYEAHLPGKESQ
ncbi:L,D-transpeptidase [Parachlamydia sp. AcF125]|uniref:L,D-transpeptidase n=1 Tax=Parachlamydia sp. AcF125 TaxID=2795736 RepID=UPI001BC9DDBB|nr:L,D-transpeptidase [Parachlamydia sp. AcF125]MBS4168520.1 hypothetical protein [Parachlamydia sp. AcF125]